MGRFEVDYNILTVVTPAVAREAKAVYSYYKERNWLYQQYIACLDPLGEGHGKTPFALTPKLYGQFLIDLFELWYQDCKKGKSPYIRQFQNYVAVAAGHLAVSCDQCGVCSIQYVVEANGNVYPCVFICLMNIFLGILMKTVSPRQTKKEKRSHLSNAPETDVYENYFCESYRKFFDACLDRIKELAHL